MKPRYQEICKARDTLSLDDFIKWLEDAWAAREPRGAEFWAEENKPLFMSAWVKAWKNRGGRNIGGAVSG